jgi:hypothetical protein
VESAAWAWHSHGRRRTRLIIGDGEIRQATSDESYKRQPITVLLSEGHGARRGIIYL